MIESGNTVAWQVDRLGAETITMTYQIRHDDVAAPSGGTLTAVINAVLTLTTPVGGAAFSEAYADVDTRSHGLQCASTTHLLLLGPVEEVRQVREVGQVHEIRQVQQVGQEH